MNQSNQSVSQSVSQSNNQSNNWLINQLINQSKQIYIAPLKSRLHDARMRASVHSVNERWFASDSATVVRYKRRLFQVPHSVCSCGDAEKSEHVYFTQVFAHCGVEQVCFNMPRWQSVQFLPEYSLVISVYRIGPGLSTRISKIKKQHCPT